jgi:hypothetical protein
MRKIYALFVACIFALTAIAQDATFYKLPDGCPLTIDGLADDVWANVEAHAIEKMFQTELPTLDLAQFQAVWNDTAIIVLVTVQEDSWCTQYCEPAQVGWMSDKPEIYFDVNDTLFDGGGPAAGNGHYQKAPDPTMAMDTIAYTAGDYMYGYTVDDPDYMFEYSVLLAGLLDHLGMALDPMAIDSIGFDCTVIDRDEGEDIRKRMVWMQDGNGFPADEAWNTMDGAGKVVFSDETVDCGSGIVTSQVESFNVYPNPAMDYIQIDATFSEVVITNIIGQESLILKDVKGTRIDISSLESGLYFISLYNNNKYIGTAKFTIQ